MNAESKTRIAGICTQSVAMAVALGTALSPGTELPAQTTVSKNYVLIAPTISPFGRTDSTTYTLVAANSDVPTTPLASANFTLAGGFIPTLGATVTGRPLLTAVTPRFVTPKSGAVLTLYGTEFGLGSSVTVTIGRRSAQVLSRAQDRITVRLPFAAGPPSHPYPGWNAIRVTSGADTTTLREGVGVLPMVFTDPAPGPNVPFNFVFKGSQNDQVVWAAGALPTATVPIPGLLFGLGLNPAAMLVLGGFQIPAPSGELRLPIPATNYGGMIFVQAVFSSQDPGYSPGSFSNLFTLR